MLKVPMVISWPDRINGGEICDHPVGGLDLVPTFFSLAGIELPWKMHGHDISPLLEDPARDWDYPLLMVNTQRVFGNDIDVGNCPENKGILCWLSLRVGQYKYIRYLKENEIEELYDLDSDPDELHNLSQSLDYRSKLEELRLGLINELERTGANFINELPSVKIMNEFE